jgi:hypothetical protein
MKIRPVGAELFHADGQQTDTHRDMTKLTVTFRKCANAPINYLPTQHYVIGIYNRDGVFTARYELNLQM